MKCNRCECEIEDGTIIETEVICMTCHRTIMKDHCNLHKKKESGDMNEFKFYDVRSEDVWCKRLIVNSFKQVMSEPVFLTTMYHIKDHNRMDNASQLAVRDHVSNIAQERIHDEDEIIACVLTDNEITFVLEAGE